VCVCVCSGVGPWRLDARVCFSVSCSDDAIAREHNFHRNVRYVNAMNRRYKQIGSDLVLAVNLLADHSEAELYQRAGVKSTPKPASNGAYRVHAAPKSLADIPSSVNWITAGAVTQVKDQGICGCVCSVPVTAAHDLIDVCAVPCSSCWSFGTAETLEVRGRRV
jgi:hypothetical protein